jgi:hypothetical protein
LFFVLFLFFFVGFVAALTLHVSLGDRLYMHEEKIRSAAHFRGVQVDLGQTEGFIPYKLVL